MNGLDWLIVAVYMSGMVAMSVYLGRTQKNEKDYYLGGNSMSYWSIGISTMATQCSTNSLLGAPAFVIATGGLLWLQYEIAVPLAMIGVMMFLLPFFRKQNVVSVYEYLEKRFGVGTRTTLSLLFQFLRAFATGVTVYGISLVLQKIIGIPFWFAAALLGTITIIYDFFGGMKAVIYSDVIQMVILYVGIAICLVYAVKEVGSLAAVWHYLPADKAAAIDFQGHGFGDGKTFAFWPMLFGGLFLYLSYYGCDQTQVQRELSSKNIDDTNMSLFINGMLRFPLVITYCLVGVALAAFLVKNPDFKNYMRKTSIGNFSVEELKNAESFAAKIRVGQDDLAGYLRKNFSPATLRLIERTPNKLPLQARQALVADLNRLLVDPQFYQSDRFRQVKLAANTQELIAKPKKDTGLLNRWLLEDAYPQELQRELEYNIAVPMFVLKKLPHGVIGIIIVALFAAAMSSLDSTINSLSATTIRDFIERFWVKDSLAESQQLLWSRLATVFWGTVCTIFAFFVGGISNSIIESINKIGSVANGPILATFLLAILTRRANGKGTVAGIFAGFGVNIYLWLYQPKISWMWWNVIGCVVTFGIGYLFSLLLPAPSKDIDELVYHRDSTKFFNYQRKWPYYYAVLAAYAMLLVGICYGIGFLKG